MTDNDNKDQQITPEIVKLLRIKSDMINMGEKIAWGSETALMDEAATFIEQLTAEIKQLRADNLMNQAAMVQIRETCKAMGVMPAFIDDCAAYICHENKQLRAERVWLLEWLDKEIEQGAWCWEGYKIIKSKLTDASSSNGRTPDFESENCGSIPQEAAKLTDSAQRGEG